MKNNGGSIANLRHIVEVALSAASEKNILTSSALGHRTLSQTILWADTVSRNHHATGQPKVYLRDAARTAAQFAYEALPDNASFSLAVEWKNRLLNNDTVLVNPGELQSFLIAILDRALCAGAAETNISHWGLELAAGLIEDERSIAEIEVELGNLFQRKDLDNIQLCERARDVLLPPIEEYMVLLGVSGATDLAEISSLDSEGRIICLQSVGSSASYRDWGGAGGKAAEFVNEVSSHSFLFNGYEYAKAPKVFLQVRTRASDFGSAGRKSVRILQQTLDTFHAVHPTAILSIFAVAGISRSGDPKSRFEVLNLQAQKWDAITLPVLESHDSLAASRRINSLARMSPPTVTRASFAWVAIESGGIRPSDLERCGQALALLELRQIFISRYLDFIKHPGLSNDSKNSKLSGAKHLDKRARRLRKQGSQTQYESRLSLAARRLEMAAALHRRLAILHANAANEGRRLVNTIEVAGLGSRLGDPAFARLRDFDSWARILKGVADGTATTQTDSVDRIMKGMTPERRNKIRSLTELAQSPPLVLARIRDKSDYFTSQLRALYAARNLHLHNGVHDLSGEVGLAQFGVVVADALLEIWTLWLADSENNDPKSSILELSARYDTITEKLIAGKYLEELDLGSLAAPTWAV